ncbi:MAG: hypothetical protein BWK76_00655 [Desulfobulbaceae bacterium A2]|nr:MAG: hypothetical protein BWK76_00655 [Desulfobulbaceae bacterium A2]
MLILTGDPPCIIPPEEHPIRIGDIDRDALKILYRLRDAGFSGYLVGGGVRDLYLGKRPKDFDIGTTARPGQLRRIFRNSRTIGRRFRLVQVYFRGGKIIEVSTLRSLSEYDIEGDETKVLPQNNTFGSLEEDAFRRDLTINSLFFEIENSTIIDYVGGVEDLKQGVVRVIGEPERRFLRDPVRILRALRHAARNSFRIEDRSWEAIIRQRDKLTLCPSSRIRDELLRDLRGGASGNWLRLAVESGVFFVLLPCYAELRTDWPAVEGELLTLLGVCDRLHRLPLREEQSIQIPDAMLFGLLMLPWLRRRCALEQAAVGAARAEMLQQLRHALEEALGERFNLKAMIRDEMSTLLGNLPQLLQHGQAESGCPGWLRRKSYFRDCQRFLRLWQEAQGGDEVASELFLVTRKVDYAPLALVEPPSRVSADVPVTAPVSVESRSEQRRNDGRPGRPAYSPQSGGVFGLRRR